MTIQLVIMSGKVYFFFSKYVTQDADNLNEWIVDNVGLNKGRVLPDRVCTSRAARAGACERCCSAPLFSYFSQPASIPATSQPAITSLLLGQQLSKGIILLFPTPLFLRPSLFLFLFLAQVLPSLARPSRHRSLQKSGRLSDTPEDEPLTPTQQDKFINLLQLSQFLQKPQLDVLPGASPLPRCHLYCLRQRQSTRLPCFSHLHSSSWHLKVQR